MYIIKTKGSVKIPDYIQVRDNNFILVDHFRVDRLFEVNSETGILNSPEMVRSVIAALPFGVLKKFDV